MSFAFSDNNRVLCMVVAESLLIAEQTLGQNRDF